MFYYDLGVNTPTHVLYDSCDDNCNITPDTSPLAPCFSPIVTATATGPLLSTIHDQINISNTPWLDVTRDSASSLRYCMLINSDLSQASITNPIALMFTVVITSDLKWQVFVGNHVIEAQKFQLLSCIPTVVTSSADVEHLLSTLQKYKICCGNPDEKYGGK